MSIQEGLLLFWIIVAAVFYIDNTRRYGWPYVSRTQVVGAVFLRGLFALAWPIFFAIVLLDKEG